MYRPATFIEHAQKHLDLQAEAAKIKAAAKELREIEIGKAAFAGTALDWKLLRPESPVAIYLQKGLQDSLGAFGNQEFLRMIESSRSPLEKLWGGQPLLPIDQMSKVFSDLFIKPAEFRAALEYAVNTPIAGMRETAAQFAKAMENISRPLGVLHEAAKIAAQSKAKAGSEESAHADEPTPELKSDDATEKAPDVTDQNDKDKQGGDRGK